MNVALVAPLISPIRSPFLGGSQALVHRLGGALAARGHAVTLYAAEGSTAPKGVRLASLGVQAVPEAAVSPRDPPPDAVAAIAAGFASIGAAVRGESFDVVHAHAFDAPAFEVLGRQAIHTLHLPPLKDDVVEGVRRAARAGARVACVSQAAAREWAAVTTIDAVLPNGVDVGQVPFGEHGAGHLLFAGRLAPEKGLEDAVAIARAAGRPLRVAGAIYDRAYFEDVRALLQGPGVEYLGSLRQDTLYQEMASADAVLLPVQWNEPFGLVLIEAMAAGSPVVAYARGGIPEVVRDGTTGFLVPPGDQQAAARALSRLGTVSRRACRAHVEAHFGLDAMARRHLEWYDRVLAGAQR